MKVKVYKCDGCGKLVEKSRDIYVLKLETPKFRIPGDPELRDEKIEIELHFCAGCAADLMNTLKKIAKALYKR